MAKIFVTVFTPTYNRAKTLSELYASLKKQTFKDFEWIIVDDGSADNTKKCVETWVKEKIINIRYIYQVNHGKHIAMNRAVDLAKGELFTVVDSDDHLLPDALEILVNTWNEIPRSEWGEYSSVKSNCIDLTSREKLGPEFEGGKVVCSYLDARYRKKINYEMQSLTRTEVLREYSNPEILGGAEHGGLRFYPETIWQDLAGRKYKTVFIDECTCAYRRDLPESLLGRGKKYNRYRENIHLWAHIINDNMDYFFFCPGEFIKAFIGMSMDGFFNKFSVRQVLSRINGFGKRLGVLIFYPVGYLCYIRRK